MRCSLLLLLLHGKLVQVRGTLFNETFSVIVTADESGTVCVWNVLNGHREGRFQKAHGTAKVSRAKRST